MANRRNPLCVVIPCHRVVATDRSLGGYVAGLKTKKLLLGLERSREPERL
jgi:methylated-DNA-[protein]-cysteine S-methyltransferase